MKATLNKLPSVVVQVKSSFTYRFRGASALNGALPALLICEEMDTPAGADTEL